MGVFRMSTKVIFDTNGDYTVESEDMIRKESGSSINEENKKQEGKEPLRQKQPKQPSKRKSRKVVEKPSKESEEKPVSTAKNKKQLNKMLDANSENLTVEEDASIKNVEETPTVEEKVIPETKSESVVVAEQPVQVEEKTNTTFENVIFLTISEFLKNENIEKDLFTNQILSKLHVFICTPATAHHIGNNLVIYGAIQLDTNEVVLHCISLKSNIHTIFVFYINKSEVADVKFNIAPSGILKVDETMVCSLRAKPNGI